MSTEESALNAGGRAIAAGNTRSAEEFVDEMGDDAVSALKIMCWLGDRLTHSDEIASDQSLDWERRTAAQGEAYAFALAHEFVRNALAEGTFASRDEEQTVTVSLLPIADALSAEASHPADIPHGPDTPPVAGRARTVEISDRTGRTDPDVP